LVLRAWALYRNTTHLPLALVAGEVADILPVIPVIDEAMLAVLEGAI
jgi:hypothetical protein